MLEVVSLAQSHLTAPATRRGTDRTLAQEQEDALKGSIEFALNVLQRLDPGTRSALIDEAAAAGDRARAGRPLIGRACGP